MNLLGASPIILSTLGHDATDYLSHIEKNNISSKYISTSKDKLSSSAHITTDKDDNQLTAFYSGASEESVNLSINNIKEKIHFAIISPTKKEAMLKHALECRNAQIPFCFDPGQQVTAFTPQELMQAIGQAQFLIANDYEIKLISEKTGWDTSELLNHVQTLIITLGEKGSVISTKEKTFEIMPCKPKSTDDPTGAGDAYRAGFFTAYAQGCDLETCGQVGSVSAVYAVEHYGTQTHKFTKQEFTQRYEDTYLKTISLEL
jgi:adenosine kinase